MNYLLAFLLFSFFSNAEVFPQDSNFNGDFIDSTVIGISLLSSKSLNKLGNVKLVNEDGIGIKNAQFYNKSKNEFLVLAIEPETHQITEYTFYYLNSKKKFPGVNKLHCDKFVSGKGVTLGMSENELLRCLGKPNKVELHGEIKDYNYTIEDKQFPYLRDHHAVKYLSRYRFKQNKLFEAGVQIFLP